MRAGAENNRSFLKFVKHGWREQIPCLSDPASNDVHRQIESIDQIRKGYP